MKVLVSAVRGEEKGALPLKRDGQPFTGGKLARRAFRAANKLFKRGGAYIINGPGGKPIELPTK